MSEKTLLDRIILALSPKGARIFRQNVGTGWSGKAEKIATRRPVMCNPGDVVVRNARLLRAGLCVGSSDLIGWMPVQVTPAMVGQTVAVFTAIEVKTENVRATPDQVRFVNAVAACGGISRVVWSEEEALEALEL